jgi:tetratricopeptide (TPR) repeat protein
MNSTDYPRDFADPLRVVRLAVQRGRFKEAWSELTHLDTPVQGSAEGRLLGAMATWRLGEYARSRSAALEARDAFRAKGDSDGEMRAENVAAAGAFALGALDDAERGFMRALELADQLTDDLLMARSANNLGNVAYYRADTQTALSFYRLAIANFDKLAFRSGLAEAWLNTAIVLLDAGQLEASREAGEQAVEAAEAAGDQRILGQALAARSETAAAIGDLNIARALAERARSLATTHDHIVGEADALRILSIIARMSGEPDRSEQLVEEALDIAARVNDPWRRAEAERDLGELYQAVGRVDDASVAFADAANAFEQLGAVARATHMRKRLSELAP